MQEQYTKDDMEIDILDLIRYLLGKWKLMLAGLIICALIGDGVWIARQLMAQPSAGLETSLSDEDKAYVEEALIQYRNLEQQSTAYKDYYDNSVYLTIDCNAVPQVTYDYVLTSAGEDTGETVVALISHAIHTDEVNTALAKVTGYDKRYVSELYSVSATKAAEGTDASTQTISLRVVAPTKNECEILSEALKPIMDDAVRETMESLQCKITYVSSSYCEAYDQDFMGIANTAYQNYVTAEEAVSAYTDTLSEEQLAYFNTIVEGETDDAVSADDKEPEKASMSYISVKYVAIGAILGIFLVCLYFGLIYLLNGKIKTADDMKYLGVPGTLGREIPAAVLTDETVIANLARLISLMAEKDGRKQLVIGTTLHTEEIATFITSIIQHLDDTVDADMMTLFALGLNDTEKLSRAEGVVLVEQIFASADNDIIQAVELCGQCRVPVMGAIVIR